MKTQILWASMTVGGGLLLVMFLTRALAVQAQEPITGDHQDLGSGMTATLSSSLERLAVGTPLQLQTPLSYLIARLLHED